MINPRDYSPIFDALPYAALEVIRQRLDLPRNRFLDYPYETLVAARLCAADAVVALAGSPLREAREAMEEIFGRPITVCPPCLSRLLPCLSRPVVIEVLGRGPGRTYPGGGRRSRSMAGAAARYALLRPGMTVRAYLSRVGEHQGRRDLREWGHEGSVRLSD